MIFRTYGESILGQKVETISQLRINNTIVPVVNGKAIFYGLNIPIPPNEQPVNIDVYISYFGINAATQKSPLTAQIEMEGYVYTTATRVGTKGSANIRFNN